MESATDYAPPDVDVKTQLERMLESDEFASSPRLSQMLRHIVVNTLPDEEGKTDPEKLTEHQIGHALFDTYDLTKTPENDVRVNASNLRKRIHKYYANSGRGDRVAIDIPPGGYRAVFSYNGTSPAGKLYRRACSLASGFMPSAGEHLSVRLLREAVEADPDYAPAHAALAEAELREAMYRRTIPPHNPLTAAEASALNALRLQERLWRPHVTLGAVHCCSHRWIEAGQSFNAALSVAPHARRDHAWYAGFLLAMGGRREELEALRLARSRAEAKPEDVSALVTLGFFLYLVRQFDEADELLTETIERFPASWLARIVQACVYLAQDRAGMALVTIEEAHEILREQDDSIHRFDVFPGLLNLCSFRGGDEGYKHVAREDVKNADTSDYWAVYEVRHAAGEVPGDYDGWEVGHFDGHIPYWTPLQLALGYIGLGDKESAIDALTRAVNEGDPLTVFLRRLPLFDELRGDAAFESLIEGMNFPK